MESTLGHLRRAVPLWPEQPWLVGSMMALPMQMPGQRRAYPGVGESLMPQRLPSKVVGLGFWVPLVAALLAEEAAPEGAQEVPWVAAEWA